jgi:hypothetical protein
MVQRTSNAEVMSMDLSPKMPAKAYGGEGGAYYDWSLTDLPMLGAASIGAAKLHLASGGLSLPSYSDSAKVAYVLQGAGACGLVLPEAAKEKVIPVKTGDALALPFGAVTWWHNAQGSDTELVVLFLGDTSKGHVNGKFTNFQLTGATGIFTGFSTEFVARAWDLDQDSAAKLVSTQPGSGIVKLAAGHKMPEPCAVDRNGMVLNCLEAPLDVDIPGGGRVVVLNTANLPLVKEVGLGAPTSSGSTDTPCARRASHATPRTRSPTLCAAAAVCRWSASMAHACSRPAPREAASSSCPGSSSSPRSLMRPAWSGSPSSPPPSTYLILIYCFLVNQFNWQFAL